MSMMDISSGISWDTKPSLTANNKPSSLALEVHQTSQIRQVKY